MSPMTARGWAAADWVKRRKGFQWHFVAVVVSIKRSRVWVDTTTTTVVVLRVSALSCHDGAWRNVKRNWRRWKTTIAFPTPDDRQTDGRTDSSQTRRPSNWVSSVTSVVYTVYVELSSPLLDRKRIFSIRQRRSLQAQATSYIPAFFLIFLLTRLLSNGWTDFYKIFKHFWGPKTSIFGA